MRAVKVFGAILLSLLVSAGLSAQTGKKDGKPELKTESFKANGACGMCKNRIENGLKMEGISKAEWSKETKMVTVSYEPSKVSLDDIKKKVASLGHDTDKFRAPDDVYAKLPGCCHYDRTK
jgi:copper chaperone CopZ